MFHLSAWLKIESILLGWIDISMAIALIEVSASRWMRIFQVEYYRGCCNVDECDHSLFILCLQSLFSLKTVSDKAVSRNIHREAATMLYLSWHAGLKINMVLRFHKRIVFSGKHVQYKLTNTVTVHVNYVSNCSNLKTHTETVSPL